MIYNNIKFLVFFCITLLFLDIYLFLSSSHDFVINYIFLQSNMEFDNDSWAADGLSANQLFKVIEIEGNHNTVFQSREDFLASQCSSSRSDPSTTFTKDPTDTISNRSGVVITVEKGGDDVHLVTPSASPNTSFEESHNAAFNISPSLRNLGPGYVSNLAQFWALKSKQGQDMDSFFKFGSTRESIGNGGNVEKLLEENETFLSEADPSLMKETIFVQCEMIRDLEEEKSKLNATIEGFKKENDKVNESVRELEDILESKSTQVEYLRENLNNCNDKVSKLLKEDLEKNYKIIELEGTIDDLNVKNKKLLDDNEALKKEIEMSKQELTEALQDLNGLRNIGEAHINVVDSVETFIHDDDLKKEIKLLDKDVAKLRNSFRGTKRERKFSFEGEIFKMKTLVKSTKKKRKYEINPSNPDQISETTFSDTSSSSFEKTNEGTPTLLSRGTLGNFFRSSLRSSGKKKTNEKDVTATIKVKKGTKGGEDCRTH